MMSMGVSLPPPSFFHPVMRMPGLYDGQDLISDAEILHVQAQTQDETELQ